MSNQIFLKTEIESSYGYDESIKKLRTNVQFCGNGVRTIMFTSSIPNEGKSLISFSFAYSMGQIGKKVLLIDADIRKSVFISRYQLDKEVVGLSQYLSGQKKLDEVLYETNYENLTMVFAGPYSPNPSELLEESLFGDMLEEVKKRYDYIVIDTPPMGNLIDGAIIAGRCDGAILVVESGTVSYRLVQRVKIQLEKSGCRILGAVLNKTNSGKERYYREYKKYKNEKSN